jgi:butyrate kinase
VKPAPLLLVINPGAGSTKLGLFRGEALEREAKLEHAALATGPAARCWNQLPARLAAVRGFLEEAGVDPASLDAVVGRGGLLPPVPAGTFEVDAAMLAELERAERGDHASNLGAPLARALAALGGGPAFVVDPVAVDELEPAARLTGLPGVERRSFTHALNIRAVARRHAASQGRPLASLGLVVAHLGTGISLAALRDGRMVDVVNPQDEGPMSGDRAGAVPVTALLDLCFAPGAERGALRRRLFGEGGLQAHLGTRDVREALRRAAAGDRQAALLLEAMTLQVGKAIGGLAASLSGRVDAVLLTGGLAHLPEVVEPIRMRVAFVAPVVVLPGEDELKALAEGALRVLRGEEAVLRYRELPLRYGEWKR